MLAALRGLLLGATRKSGSFLHYVWQYVRVGFLSPWSEVLSPLLSADSDGEGEGEGVVPTDLPYTQLLRDETECFP